ncbi:unnamed protein product [Closterium sp. NIES-64]|nr:unnamed protein product [Closterium sp. NIES-65]CAI5993615.1 unnamed protein product [Closterium sp. NIES-64]CAI5999218.1 unnamed protein product [Closterium sp. NIES-65]
MAEFTTVPPREAKALLETSYTFLDVRTEEEFAKSHVEGAVNVAVMTGDPHKGASEKRSDFLDVVRSKFQPDTPLVVSCGAGRRAAVAAADLVEAGFTKVVSLEGGLKAWKGEGFPLVE